MIGYNDITLKELIDEVIMRIGRYNIYINLSEQEIIYYINKAVRFTIIKCLPFKLNAFTNRIIVQHRTPIPRNYVRYIRCLLGENVETILREARYADIREFHQTTYWRNKSAFHGAWNYQPIFSIWNNGGSLIFLCYPNTQYENGTPPEGFYYADYDAEGYLYYHYLPDIDYNNYNDILPIPPEFQEYLIQDSVFRVISKKIPEQQSIELYKNLVNERQKLYNIYNELKMSKHKELDKYIFEYEELLKLEIRNQGKMA